MGRVAGKDKNGCKLNVYRIDNRRGKLWGGKLVVRRKRDLLCLKGLLTARRIFKAKRGVSLGDG